MKFDLRIAESVEVKDGKWFDYDDDVRFKLRYVSPEKARRLKLKHTTKKYKKGVLEDIVDDDGYSDALADFVLVDWSGVLIGDDPAPCDLTNKKKMLDVSVDHARFVYQTAQDLNQFVGGEKEEDLLGNSEAG